LNTSHQMMYLGGSWHLTCKEKKQMKERSLVSCKQS
jgi:hypothetical protein